MARNIKYQFKYCIEKNFFEGMNKHSMKKNKDMNGTRIFSYSDRKNLIDFSANFSNFLKEKYPNLKFIRDIKQEHIQEFLNIKEKNNCSSETLKQYFYKFKKLENVANSIYDIDVNFTKNVVIPAGISDKIRNTDMKEADFLALRNYFKDKKTVAKIAIEVAHRSGLRVSEIAKLQKRDIDLEKNVIRIIDSKGKRDREVPISKEDYGFYKKLKESVSFDTDRICAVRKDSINKAINRGLKALGLSEKYRDTSIHALRKSYAQRQFDNLRFEGKNVSEALNIVSALLGHGENRSELMRQYVLEIK